MLKRAFDFIVALTLILLLLPVIAAVAVIICWQMGTPVLFWQVRPGLQGKPFEVVKFRTMAEGRNASGEPLPDAARLTRLGRFLRHYSLDELPQLFNVIKGDMSLIGPRPLLMEYLPLYTATQMRRHEVLPGLSGWAQVSGRNALSWEDKFVLDVWYVDHQSFCLDMKILAMTIGRVFSGAGVAKDGFATTEKFSGNPIHNGTDDLAHYGNRRESP